MIWAIKTRKNRELLTVGDVVKFRIHNSTQKGTISAFIPTNAVYMPFSAH